MGTGPVGTKENTWPPWREPGTLSLALGISGIMVEIPLPKVGQHDENRVPKRGHFSLLL